VTAEVQPNLCCCFEAGAAGTPLAEGGGFYESLGTSDGAQFDVVNAAGGTITYDSTYCYSGTQSCKIVTTANGDAYFSWGSSGMLITPATQTWFRIFVCQTAWPAATRPLFGFYASGTRNADVILHTNGTLSVRDTNGNTIVTTTSTVPNNAWYRIEGYCTSNASTGQVELKLFASPASATPTETQTSAATQDTLGGPIGETRFGISNAAGSGHTFWMDDPACSTSGYIGPVPAVIFHMVCGAPADASFGVVAKPVGGTSLRLKVATNEALTSGVFYEAAQTPDQYGYVSYQVTGLSPSATYYCQLADTPPGGSEALSGPAGQCMTLPVPGTITSYTVAFASCIDTGDVAPSPNAAISDWVGWDAGLNIFLGDYGYFDSTDTTVSGWLGYIEYQSMYYDLLPLTSTAWGFYVRSDHDSTTAGGDSGNTWTAANIAAVAEAFPQGTLANPDNPPHGLYQSFVMGRVRFILLDIRNTDRSPVANTDNSSKTMLGANQLAWLEQQLLMPEPLKVLCLDTSWIGNTSQSSCGPGWGYYSTERAAIISFIAANAPAVKNVLLWHGDAHGVAACPGWGNPDGGFSVYCAAPMRQDSGSDATAALACFPVYYNNSGGQCRFYGRVTVTDSGQTITVNFQGWDAVNQVAQITQTDTFNVACGFRPLAGVL
jgi:hypothetical protein